MEYLKPKFTVPLGSDAYRSNWDAVFGDAARERAVLEAARSHCDECGLIGEHDTGCRNAK